MGEEGIIEQSSSPRRPLLVHQLEAIDYTNGEATNKNNSSITHVLVLSALVAVCGSFNQGCAAAYSSPAESGIREDLGLSIAEYSMFGSILTIGGMAGAVTSGKIADLIGRKRGMWLCQIFCVPGWLAISLAKDVWWLDIGRLAVGIGIGLSTFVIPVYIAEITPKDVRGRFTSTNQLMAAIGFSVMYFVGNIVSWRILSLIPASICVMQVIGLSFVPESPRWLAKSGNDKEFEAALQYLRGKNANISLEANDIRDLIETIQPNKSEAKTVELFQMKYAYPVMIGVGLMVLQQLCGDNGLAFYTYNILVEAGFSPVVGTTIMSILQVPLALVGFLLMDVLGRKTLLMISSAGACFAMLLIGLAFHFQEVNYLKETTPTLVFIGILANVVACNIGLLGIPWVIMSEVIPINIKDTAGSLVTLAYWSTSWLVTYSFNFLMEWSHTGTFLIFCGTSGLTFVFVWKLVPETRGRTLEEIQATITQH